MQRLPIDGADEMRATTINIRMTLHNRHTQPLQIVSEAMESPILIPWIHPIHRIPSDLGAILSIDSFSHRPPLLTIC